ncbi:MAG: glycosyltransferase family 4 protein [Bryobacterales bacterium]|nr:glycosyltransferase family 4 protein [Bryobacterales bacterium]
MKPKIVTVFAAGAADAARAVRHVQSAGLPIWLFTLEPPDPVVAALCGRVACGDWEAALRDLGRHWSALTVVVWARRGPLAPRVRPLLRPPFRVLVLNEHGDFFNATPAGIARHLLRRSRDRLHSIARRIADWGSGLGWWLFLRAAQYSVTLSRWAFRKLPAGAPIDLPVPPATGESYVTVLTRQRQWDLTGVRAAVSGDTRWILFAEEGAPASVDDLIPLMRCPGTFAVSRQAFYRDWNEGLFARAPFRPLQPGEASRVLAPVGPLMLVDRARMEALGVPRTIVPGSAWLWLFWRAAAAGWHSYSIGAAETPSEAPDWPYEDAEFVTLARRTPPVAPRDAALARGNISFAVHGPQPFRGLKRVLVVSPYLPYPLTHGGAVRIWNLCRALASRYDLLLAAFREKDEQVEYEQLHTVFRRVYVVERDEHPGNDRGLPKQVREHRSSAMEALIASLAAEVSVLQVEYAHLAAFRDAAPALPAILVEHDLTFMLYQQLQAGEEAERWRRFERHWFNRYDAVWTMSEDDRALAIQEGASAAATAVVANGVDTARFTPQCRPDGPPEILVIGSFRHLPNILGFEWLARQVMPLVWREVTDARLHCVAGPEPDRYWRELTGRPYPASLDPRIVRHAFVSDVRPLYTRASVVAVPLVVSAGTNIKVMEAMACGRAVVSTPVGCYGLGLRHEAGALIHEQAPDFAAALVRLLRDADLRERIERQARATVESRFSWESIAEDAAASYEALTR